MQQEPPPPTVSMGTVLGGGAMVWLQQQMWPVQGWRGGVGGGRRRCAWQQGPAWDVAGLRLDAGASLWPQVHQLQKVPRVPRALGLALGAPGYLPAFHRLGPAPGPALSQRGSGPPAEGPASTRSAWTGSLDGAARLLLCPSQRLPRVGSQPLQKVCWRTQ